MHKTIAIAFILGLFLGADCRKLTATVSRSSALAVGNASASSSCKATNGNTADCSAVAIGTEDKKAVAVAKGTAETGNVNVEAVADALTSGDGDTIAIAIGKAVQSAGGPDKAGTGLSDVFVQAVNEGKGKAVAIGIADGVAKGGDVKKAVVIAVAQIINGKGCDVVKPTLALAYAEASNDGKIREFADAFDVDVKVAECIYPHCSDDRWHCCGDESKCSNYSTFKTTPRLILTCTSCAEKQCICPK